MKVVQLQIFLTNTIVITVLALDYDEPDELQVTLRPLPPDLLVVNNKTEYEMALEACMDEYVVCITTLGKYSKNKKICTENQYKKKKVYQNTCDMMYATCKSDKESWHFVKDDDGHCS